MKFLNDSAAPSKRAKGKLPLPLGEGWGGGLQIKQVAQKNKPLFLKLQIKQVAQKNKRLFLKLRIKQVAQKNKPLFLKLQSKQVAKKEKNVNTITNPQVKLKSPTLTLPQGERGHIFPQFGKDQRTRT